jgi:hypothetical protein
MDAEVPPLTTLSHAAAASMLGRLQEHHPGNGRSLEESLTVNGPELQRISEEARQVALRQLFADAKAGRAAGGVGAERRFDKAMGEMDAVEQGWDVAVEEAFRRQLQDWVDSGGSVLGAGGWIRVTVRPYHRGSVWWTDSQRADQWCRTIAGDVFTCIVADPRARAGDTVRTARLSEPTVGPALDVSVMAMLGDFQDQQRYDAVRYAVHPLQAQAACARIDAMRGPLLATCRAELVRLLQEWDSQGPIDARRP